MFRGEGGKAFFQEAAVEVRVVGYHEDHSAQQIVDDAIVNAVADDHLIGNARNFRDLRRDRTIRIFEPLPAAESLVNPSALAVILKQADPEFDDFVAEVSRSQSGRG